MTLLNYSSDYYSCDSNTELLLSMIILKFNTKLED